MRKKPDQNGSPNLDGLNKQEEDNLSLKIYPDSVLREVCDPVERFDSELSDLLDAMLRLMRANNGIGLAGPQVGITRRLFVCEIQGRSLCLVNPKILEGDGKADLVEGCLSLPDVQVDVTRNREIQLTAYDPSGRQKQLKASALWARVIQHEIDHLDGVLICDHGEPVNSPSAAEPDIENE